MATVLLPRSLLALFPGVEKRHDVSGDTVGDLLVELDRSVPGLRDRLVDSGPVLRRHINVFVDGEPGDLATSVQTQSVVHVLPAGSGGAGRRKVAGGRAIRAGAEAIGIIRPCQSTGLIDRRTAAKPASASVARRKSRLTLGSSASSRLSTRTASHGKP